MNTQVSSDFKQTLILTPLLEIKTDSFVRLRHVTVHVGYSNENLFNAY